MDKQEKEPACLRVLLMQKDFKHKIDSGEIE